MKKKNKQAELSEVSAQFNSLVHSDGGQERDDRPVWKVFVQQKVFLPHSIGCC